MQTLLFAKVVMPLSEAFMQIVVIMQSLKGSFCSSVGLLEACEITLKTSVGNTRSWSVCFKNAINYGYLSGPGLKRFCSENNLKEGDCCTFRVIETTVWHVTIVSS